MKYADTLRAKAAEARQEMEALDTELRSVLAAAETEERRATAEEDVRADEIIARHAALKTQVEADEARAAELDAIERARHAAPSHDNGVDFVSDPGVLRSPSAIKNPWDLDELRSESRDNPQQAIPRLAGRARAAVERAQGLTERQREVLGQWVDSVDEESGESGVKYLRHIIATSSPDYMRAWVAQFKAAARGGMNPDASMVLQRAMSLTDNAGGYAVPQQLDPNLILTSNGSTNPIRTISRVVQATGDTWTGLSTTHASWSWDAEAAEVSDDATTYAQPSVPVYTGRGFIPFSMEVQMDYPGFTDDLRLILANGKDDLEATAFATGSGSGQPTGIVTALTGGASAIASAGSEALAWGDVTGLNNVLPAKYRARASWIAEQRIISEIREDAIGAGYEGAYIDPAGAAPGRLLGHDIYEASAMDGVITGSAENYILVLGDFSNYVIADRVGFSLELVPHLLHTSNNRPSGQRGFLAYYRVGADSVNDAAFRMLNAT
jgi:HK97 family phage major capsid protein